MGRRTENRADAQRSSTLLDERERDYEAADVSGPDRTIFLTGDVDEHQIGAVQSLLLTYAAQNLRPIYLVISTYGGSVDEMFSLYDLIKMLPCPVHTVGLGKVMSAGVLLLAAGTKGNRLVGRNTRLMVHAIGQHGFSGNVFEHTNNLRELQRQQNMLVSALADETRLTKDKLRKIMNGQDYYVSAREAVEFGIADRVTDVHELHARRA